MFCCFKHEKSEVQNLAQLNSIPHTTGLRISFLISHMCKLPCKNSRTRLIHLETKLMTLTTTNSHSDAESQQ